jgi:hypothetical protein
MVLNFHIYFSLDFHCNDRLKDFFLEEAWFTIERMITTLKEKNLFFLTLLCFCLVATRGCCMVSGDYYLGISKTWVLYASFAHSPSPGLWTASLYLLQQRTTLTRSCVPWSEWQLPLL